MDKPIIGIDLGTSTSEITFLRNGRPELIQDKNGDRIIPSVVQIREEGHLEVGRIAKATAVVFPERTVLEVKRKMGTDEIIRLGDKFFRPEEISAVILRHLKETAEARFGEGAIKDVVITVPARYENPEREATKAAARMAGLNVVRLINEPTSAALSYGLDNLEDEQKVLVFDFGGGTLDVTIMEMMEGVLDVRTSVGDARLGGKDVDALLIEEFRRAYQQKKGTDLPSQEQDPALYQELKDRAEEVKCQLSSAQTAEALVKLPDSTVLSVPLSRAQFEHLLAPLTARAMTLVDEALERARMTYADIDVILPVGGSSRIPLFRRTLEQRWGKPLREYDNPDEAVARGAAIQAGIEARQYGHDSIMVLDNVNHRLGVSVLQRVGDGQYIDEYFSEIIPKDDKLPTVRSHTYSTVYDGQDSIRIRAYEASTPSNLCPDHRLVAEIPMEGIPKAPAGQPINIEFSYSLDGTLQISAHCVHAPDVRIDKQIKIHGEVDQAAVSRFQVRLEDLWSTSERAKDCKPLISQAERVALEHPAAAGKIGVAVEALKRALASGVAEDVERTQDELTNILYEFS